MIPTHNIWQNLQYEVKLTSACQTVSCLYSSLLDLPNLKVV